MHVTTYRHNTSQCKCEINRKPSCKVKDPMILMHSECEWASYLTIRIWYHWFQYRSITLQIRLKSLLFVGVFNGSTDVAHVSVLIGFGQRAHAIFTRHFLTFTILILFYVHTNMQSNALISVWPFDKRESYICADNNRICILSIVPTDGKNWWFLFYRFVIRKIITTLTRLDKYVCIKR